MKKLLEFQFDCTQSTAEVMDEIVDQAHDITHDTFLRHCGKNFLDLEKQLGYGNGLRMRQDYAVSFHKSKHNNKVCYYLRWSGIEFVFQ